MKFFAFYNVPMFDENLKHTGGKYFYTYLVNNDLIDVMETQAKAQDENNAPLSLEYDFSSNFQLKYLSSFIENVFKLVILRRSK